ncbi:hypothetical protein GPECTOR_509g477 [Gonium pectorale]|uniref:Ricin B lectin domain-containing protein n=1 Tax=Gonium pectorale TaxID=33097 RepID=A0A150FWH1_GONPE|nr:hypothetical protein GPECTOR_509g477 [Gonium pectorale]|eukprot:KXZ41380.1 hypothetical protein GPECTOR_509g477 [Gonium pectorale]
MYNFAIYPLWQKIEVTAGKTVYAWQENVLPVGSSNEVHQYFCGNYSTITSGAAGFNASSVLNYTYTGVDSVGDKLARHFELTVTQLTDTAGKTDVMRIDYWDSLDTYTPLRFQFSHKDIGTVMIDVVEFRSISASSPEAQPAMFEVPALQPNASCPNDPTLPRLSTPFMARGAVVSADAPDGPNPASGRRLIASSIDLAQRWNKLDHVQGSGDWPEWALDMYGGAHPANRGLLASTRRMLGECGTKVSVGLDFEPCGLDFSHYANGAFALGARCGGSVGPIELEGSIEADTCDQTVKGCLTVGVGFPKDNWLVKKIGIDLSIDIASACVGYNTKDRFFFIEASLILNLIVFKAELSMEMDFTSCCVWIASVNLEASIGVSFFNFWVTVGDIGFWGNWYKASYPCAKYAYNSAKGGMEVIGMPMNSFQLRIEASLDDGDDTALNGLSVGCLSGAGNTVEDGSGFWGDWTKSASCGAGGYFVGARIRIEPQQGDDGDDTAANSIAFTCSNDRGAEVKPHNGYFGDWSAWTYCPGETYICGLQVRQETPGGDDTGMNGLRIACCNFPAIEAEAAVASAGIIKTRGSTSSSTCLDVTNGNLSPGSYIQQWACSKSGENAAQYFTVTSTATGTYTIATTKDG